MAFAVERHAPADHPGIAAEVPLPERVGEDHGLWPVQPIVLGRERAAVQRIRAAQPEEVRADAHDLNLFRNGFAGEIDDVEQRVGGNVLEGRGLLTPMIEFRGRARAAQASLLQHVLEHHDPLGIGIGERFQQDGVDDREHRGVRRDPESKRQYGDDREAGALCQHPQCKAQVGGEGFQHWQQVRWSRQTLLDGFDMAEFTQPADHPANLFHCSSPRTDRNRARISSPDASRVLRDLALCDAEYPVVQDHNGSARRRTRRWVNINWWRSNTSVRRRRSV